ncbi:MAG: 1-phosphofructokinase family hexose kinase [Anaerolineae bacterium]|nr:1-phosphofructokinase family hexose kinase [Anaerolineae bacterium]
MAAVVTLTINPTVDKSTSVTAVVPERKLRCTQPRSEPGGGGINVSRAILRLGGESVAVYARGGRTGAALEELLGREGVTQQPVAIEDETRENLIVLEESSGQQYRFGMPGPHLKPDEVRRCLAVVEEWEPAPDYLVASGSLPPGAPVDLYARLAQAAQRRGVRMVLDTSGEALREAAQSHVFLLKPNVAELSQLAGCPFEEECDLEREARRLVDRGVAEVVVVSLGAAGAILVTGDDASRLRAPTVPIRSKIGAGDSMVAGIIYSLARGMSLRHSVMYGVAAGSAAVMTPGTELCRREDTERLYQRLLSLETA